MEIQIVNTPTTPPKINTDKDKERYNLTRSKSKSCVYCGTCQIKAFVNELGGYSYFSKEGKELNLKDVKNIRNDNKCTHNF